MKEKVDAYRKKLEAEISDYMERPASERAAEAVMGMLECWEALGDIGSDTLTREDCEAWNEKMKNADGSSGAVWNMAQTNAMAGNNGRVPDYCWNTAVNMMYSDYYEVGKKYGLPAPEFYAELAKAFLFDKDAKSPEAKMAAYYNYIVK